MDAKTRSSDQKSNTLTTTLLRLHQHCNHIKTVPKLMIAGTLWPCNPCMWPPSICSHAPENNWTALHLILTIDRLKRVSISPSSHSKASDDRWNSSATRLEHSVERRRMLNSNVALNWACLLMWSSPCTTISFLDSSRTPTITHNQTNQKEIKFNAIQLVIQL